MNNPAITCSRCATVNTPGSVFCQKCGQSLSVPGARSGAASTRPSDGLAIASLIVGILALVLVCVAPLSAVMAATALGLGATSLRRGAGGRGMAWTGVITSGVSLIGSVGLLALFAYVRTHPQMFRPSSTQFNAYLNRPVPDFALADTQGATHSLSQYQGKVVALNFWATW